MVLRNIFLVVVLAVALQQALSFYQQKDAWPQLSKEDKSKLYKAWWPTLFTANGLMLTIALSHKNGYLSKPLARKLIHLCMGIGFMLFWPTFPDLYWSRFVAATVPLFSTLTIVLVGTGLRNDDTLIQAATRNDERGELLEGPLVYGVAHIFGALYFWRQTPAGIIGLTVLCVGDALAEVVGQQFGSVKLPWNSRKSFAGSLACLVFGFAAAAGMAWHFQREGMFKPSLSDQTLLVAAAAAAAAGSLAESLPQGAWDNLSVVAASTAAAHYVLQHAS